MDCHNRAGRQGTLIGEKAARHGVTLSGYPITVFRQPRRVLSTIAGLVHGEPAARRAFFSDLRSDARVCALEVHGDFCLARIAEPAWTKAFYDPSLVHLPPAVIHRDGTGVYEFGSFRRAPIERLIRTLSHRRTTKLRSFRQRHISTITLLGLLPDLTAKQKAPLEDAIRGGYYGYPRKTGLDALAKASKMSLSTFREHLRIAERKVMPKLV